MNNKEKLQDVLDNVFRDRDIDSEYYLYDIVNVRPFLYIYELNENIYKEFLEYLDSDIEYRRRLDELEEAVDYKRRILDYIEEEKMKIGRCLKRLSDCNKEISVLNKKIESGKFPIDETRIFLKEIEKIRKDIKYYDFVIYSARGDIQGYKKEPAMLREKLVGKKDIDTFFVLNSELL